MEKLVDLGLARSIGLSNFNSEQVDRILTMARIKPVTNQVECSPLCNQRKLIAFLKERNITLTAYCPLAKGNAPFYEDSRVAAMAEKYNKTPAQICLRYLVSKQWDNQLYVWATVNIRVFRYDKCRRLNWVPYRYQNHRTKNEFIRMSMFSTLNWPKKSDT